MELIYPPRPLNWADIIYEIQDVLAQSSDIYVVGGAVRDAYRSVPIKDIDLASASDGQPVARHLANALGGAYFPLDRERGVGRAIIPFQAEEWVIDVSALRGDLLHDLQDRDFTVNAMAVPLQSDLNGVFDPLGGIQDWQERILRRCSPDSIANDPVRALRAIRQSLVFGLRIEPETLRDIREYGQMLGAVSSERVRDEFFSILGSGKPQGGLTALATLNLLPLIVPEVEALSVDTWRHTYQVIDKFNTLLHVISPKRDDNIAANAEFGTFVYLLDRFRGWMKTHLEQLFPDGRTYPMLLLMAALMRHTGDTDSDSAERARRRGAALKLSSDEVQRMGRTIEYAALPLQLFEEAPLNPRQVYRYWRMTRESGLDACLLALADYLAASGFQLQTFEWTAFLQMVGQLFEGYENAMHVTPFVNGDDLMAALNLQPGRQIGTLLEALREAQALGEITSAEEAIALAEQLMNSV